MATYKIKGARFLRKYKSQYSTLSYMALSEAERISSTLGEVPWVEVVPRAATFPAHSGASEESDAENVAMQDSFDAALFCAEHNGQRHRAYANAACYRFILPDEAVGASLTSIKMHVYCDPYNAAGARVSVYTSPQADPPMGCPICRTGSFDDVSPDSQSNNASEGAPATEWYSTNTHVEGVAPRRSDSGKWFENDGHAIISPAGGLTLGKYLFVFVMMENYATARAGFLEGAAFVDSVFELEVSAEIGSLDAQNVNDLSSKSKDEEYEVVVDGVFPSLEDDGARARYITLHRNGDVFHKETIKNEGSTGSRMYKLQENQLAELLDISVESITSINSVPYCCVVREQSGTLVENYSHLIAVSGIFDSGTFEELPGLFLYLPEEDIVLKDLSLGGVDITLRDFIRKHGGLSACLGMPFNTAFYENTSGVALSFIAKDGTFFKSNSNSKFSQNSTEVNDVFGFVINLFIMRTNFGELNVKACVNPFPLKMMNLFVIHGMQNSELVCVCNKTITTYRTAATLTNGGMAVTYGFINRDTGELTLYGIDFPSTVRLLSDEGKQTYEKLYFPSWGYTQYNESIINKAPQISGTFLASEDFDTSIGWDFKVTTDVWLPITSSDSQRQKYGIAMISGNFSGFSSEEGDISCRGRILICYDRFDPADVKLWISPFDFILDIPGNIKNLTLYGGVGGSDVFVLTTTSAVEKTLIAAPPKYLYLTYEELLKDGSVVRNIKRLETAELIAKFDSEKGFSLPINVYGAPGASYAAQTKMIFDLHGITNLALIVINIPTEFESFSLPCSEITNEQSAAGLRMLFGKLASKRVNRVSASKCSGSSAVFTVRGESVDVPVMTDGIEDIKSIPVWQLTAAKLIMPFALPMWDVTKVRLRWEKLTNITPGAKLNVWVKEEFVDKYPELDNVVIYDASASEVEGWRLIGTADAESTEATFALNLSGKVATFMFTAYINLDSFAPSNDMAFPLGVGAASVDVVSGKAVGLDTGWRPDITLLG